jgi:PAS domain S-box-containing protein
LLEPNGMIYDVIIMLLAIAISLTLYSTWRLFKAKAMLLIATGFVWITLFRLSIVIWGPMITDFRVALIPAYLLQLLGFILLFIELRRLKLWKKEGKFSLAFKNLPYAVTLTRASDGKIVEMNDAFFVITGYTAADVKNKTTEELGLWRNKSDRDSVVATLLCGSNIVKKEFPFMKKSGEEIRGCFSAKLIKVDGEQCILSSIEVIPEGYRGPDRRKNGR